MYKKKANGTFRLRASFPVSPDQIKGLNVICEKTGLSFSEVCSKSLDIALKTYIDSGTKQFSYPDSHAV